VFLHPIALLLPRRRRLNITCCFRYQSRGLYKRGTTEPFAEGPWGAFQIYWTQYFTCASLCKT